jgi:hypothetical protein
MKNKNKTTIIVDIDGTISEKTDRDIYDYSRVMEDMPKKDIIKLVKLLYLQWNDIVFCSGREDSCMDATKQWIRKYVFDGIETPIELYMRKKGDNRPDHIVKREIYMNKIAPRHDVWFVLDDRNSVVDMWRELGLTCLQVQKGDF